jgi:hypothetical protein
MIYVGATSFVAQREINRESVPRSLIVAAIDSATSGTTDALVGVAKKQIAKTLTDKQITKIARFAASAQTATKRTYPTSVRAVKRIERP